MNIVLDSSVIAKWFFEEENREKAIHLRQLHKQTDIAIKVPSLLLFELGNIFLNKKAFNKQFFNESISTLFSINLQFVESSNILNIIFTTATDYKLTFYDATYVALAQNLKCDFITADKKLYQKTKKLKFVKLLSNFPTI